MNKIKMVLLAVVSLLVFGCSSSRSVKILGPNNEVRSEHDVVTGWGSSADTTKVYQGREIDRCMYYMQRGDRALDEKSAYQYCSTQYGGGAVPFGGVYGGGTRGYVPGGGRGNVTMIPDYAPGPQTLPQTVGVDPSQFVTREEYGADQARVGQAIATERDERKAADEKKKSKPQPKK